MKLLNHSYIKKLMFIFFVVLFLLSFLSQSASADSTSTEISLDLAERVNNFYIWALGIGGMVALGIIIFGGVLYSASGGNPSRMGEAKTWIQSALFGLALLFSSYLLLNFLNPNLTRLQEIFLDPNPQVQGPTLAHLPGGGGNAGEDFSISPQEWGARVNYDAWNDAWVAKDKLVIHFGNNVSPYSFTTVKETQIANEMELLRGWEGFHMGEERGWRGIAYNYAIGQSGTVYRLRGWNWNGAHFNSDDIDDDGISDNKESIAVVFMIGGNQVPTSAALRGFESLRDYVEQEMGQHLSLYGHKEVAASGGHSTSCPGGPLFTYVEEHR